MADGAGSGEEREMRADARHNRERILIAAREVFAEHGPEAPLEEIARRAGVGIGTLYRRFPERKALMRAVALDLLKRITEEMRLAIAEEPDAFRALARYMQRALDLRVSAVMPLLAGPISLEQDDIFQAREQSAALIQQMIDQAHADGTLRPDVTFGDISLLLIRLSRPFPSPFPAAVADALARRHLALLLDALRAQRDEPLQPLPEPALNLGKLRSFSPMAKQPADVETAAREVREKKPD